MQDEQACELKFGLRELTSCLCSAATSAVCFEGHLDTKGTVNELSQPEFEFTGLKDEGNSQPWKERRNMARAMEMEMRGFADAACVSVMPMCVREPSYAHNRGRTFMSEMPKPSETIFALHSDVKNNC